MLFFTLALTSTEMYARESADVTAGCSLRRYRYRKTGFSARYVYFFNVFWVHVGFWSCELLFLVLCVSREKREKREAAGWHRRSQQEKNKS